MTLLASPPAQSLFEDYRPLALKLARRYRAKVPTWVEFDDLHQECKIALLRAAAHFNPDRGHAFPSYAVVVIGRAARAFVRREYNQGFSGLGKVAPAADPQVRFRRYDALSLADIIPDGGGPPAVWKQERWDYVLKCLTSRERQVVELRLFRGSSNREIGASLGIGTSRVHSLWQSAIRRIKDSVHDIFDRH
ncbi:sigma-70 family RNA polymerase sigma factor [Limnoglobus roseus]|uniref:Sigma-70 family RNA polymerase sigma factor n=1 Tax=Limnoglobus roseus TaxID=2598579 RepID=A0A5C1AK38_9BACT|nr:sigma-70 family RNA polymerase sigma factor [Limnoglobus roseus]QEL18386.1 sigma-70 family RNA polymerase sigma factor [Limnoglobus roseus]